VYPFADGLIGTPPTVTPIGADERQTCKFRGFDTLDERENISTDTLQSQKMFISLM